MDVGLFFFTCLNRVVHVRAEEKKSNGSLQQVQKIVFSNAINFDTFHYLRDMLGWVLTQFYAGWQVEFGQ